MTSTVAQRAVGIFSDRPTTASALQTLQDAGFPRRQMMVIARDAQRQTAIAGVPVQSHTTHRASQGALGGALTLGVLGGAAGFAVGLGLLTIPGLAPILGLAPGLLVGESAGAMTALGGAIAGATTGGLVGALIGLGIPVNRARQYRDRVERGAYLVLLNGTTIEIERAEEILLQQGIQDLGVYDDRAKHLQAPVAQTNIHLISAPAIGAPVTIERSLEDPFPIHQDAEVGEIPSVNAITALQLDPSPHPTFNPPPILDPPMTQPIASGDAPSSEVLNAPLAAPLRSPHPIPPKRPTQGTPSRDAGRSPYPEKRLIGTFATAQMMEQALNALKNARFPMHKISVVVRDTDSTSIDGLARSTDSDTAPSGSTLSGIAGLMVGLHRLSLPGQGTFLVIGADAPALTRTQTDTHSADLHRALMSLGISEVDTRLYSDRLSVGASLVMIRGVGGETLHATSILSQHGLQDWSIADVRDAALSRGLN